MSATSVASTTSTGSVRVCAGTKEIVFVPDNDHLAMNGDEKYAVFFAVGGGSGHLLRKLDKGGVLLKLPDDKDDLFFAALSAATTGKKVEIVVDHEPKIAGITIPAK